MAKSTDIADITGRSSLIGPKPEDPGVPPKREPATSPKSDGASDATRPAAPGRAGKLPTPGGPKPR